VLPVNSHTPHSEPHPIAVRPKEVARLLQCSERTARGLIATGEIESVKVGSMRLVPYSALEDWLNERYETVNGG